MSRGKKAVASGIAAAKPATPQPANSEGAGPDEPNHRPPPSASRHFTMDPARGLYKRTGDDGKSLWICAPFGIVAETRDDEAGRWGLLLTWKDRNGVAVSEVFARSEFSGDCTSLRARLADGGLGFNGIPAARQGFAEFMNLARADARLQVVSRTGWHLAQDGRRVFVLPNQHFGAAGDTMHLQASSNSLACFNQAGTLDEWRSAVAAPATGNPRIVFAIAAAFAGPLLELTGEDGGGFHYRGRSRTGKTTALRIAASVWGGTPGTGAAGYLTTWRASANGLEGTASQFSDTLLALDEMGQVDAKEVGAVAYMLANGSGKTRADRNGSARPAAKFRILFTSSGEVSLADKSAEARQRTHAGQEVRFIDLSADSGRYGLFDRLGNAATPAALAQHFRDVIRQHYGTAGRAFLTGLTALLERDTEALSGLREQLDRIAFDLVHRTPGAGSQVRSVARRFALVALGGELATTMGITGWQKGEATKAAEELFATWLHERGTIGAQEDHTAKLQLRDFISRHQDSRFIRWVEAAEPPPEDPEGSIAAPADRFHVQHVAGWKHWEVHPGGGHGWAFYLTPSGMQEALTGLDFKGSLKALAEANIIVATAGGKNSLLIKPPGVAKKMRAYKVPNSVLSLGDDHDDADDA
jgi:hypothetical protein